MTAMAMVSFFPAAARAKGCSPLVIGVLLGLFNSSITSSR